MGEKVSPHGAQIPENVGQTNRDNTLIDIYAFDTGICEQPNFINFAENIR